MIEDITLRSLSAQPQNRVPLYLVLSEVVMRQTLAIFNGITSRNMFGCDFRSLTVRVSIKVCGVSRVRIVMRTGTVREWWQPSVGDAYMGHPRRRLTPRTR